MVEFAYTKIGLTPSYFYSLTFYEYQCVLEHHKVKGAKEWEHTRLLSYTLYCMNTADKKKPSLEKYMPLYTDKKSEKPKIDEQAMKVLQEKALQRFKK